MVGIALGKPALWLTDMVVIVPGIERIALGKLPYISQSRVAVARAGSDGAGEVLRHGTQGEGTPHAALPRLERTRQLRDTQQEKETETGAAHTRQQR